MKLSAYIAELEALRKRHGDLAVEAEDPFGNRIEPRQPEFTYTRIPKGRETKLRFWLRHSDDESRRGDPVIRI